MLSMADLHVTEQEVENYAATAYIPLISIEHLPFFFGLLNEQQSDIDKLPRFLSYKWGVDAQKVLFRQFPTPELAHALQQAYQCPVTIAPPPGEGDFGRQAAEAVAKALQLFIPVDTIVGMRVLEIGCSNGLILSQFAERGALCIGIEPGPQAEVCRRRSGVEVLQDYFENSRIDAKVDIAYSINVLEHVADLDMFMAKLFEVLKPGGRFVVAVPNSEMEMSAGTPNMFVHEHYWYFTPDTLAAFLRRSGFIDVATTPAPFGSNFYIGGTWSGKQSSDVKIATEPSASVLACRGKRYVDDLNAMFAYLQGTIDDAATQGKQIGLYGASNAVNYLGMLDWKVEPHVFDTDQHNQGKYLWSRSHERVPVEPPLSDKLKAMDQIWVLPIAHQSIITKFLRDRGVCKDRILDHKGRLLNFYH